MKLKVDFCFFGFDTVNNLLNVQTLEPNQFSIAVKALH